MMPRVFIVLGIALSLGLAVAACGGPTATRGTLETPSLVPAASGLPHPAVSPVIGRLTRIDAEGLTRVKGFTLRLDDGAQLEFTIGTLENGAEFPPGHLAEHMASSSEVKVFFRDEGGTLVVYRLEDGE